MSEALRGILTGQGQRIERHPGQPPSHGDWVYEVKHDGYRFLARISDGEVKLYTRAGNDWTAKLPHLRQKSIRNTWMVRV